jgi:hypothetical protein
LAAEEASEKHQEQREGGQKERGLKGISHFFGELTSFDVTRGDEMHEVDFGKLPVEGEVPPSWVDEWNHQVSGKSRNNLWGSITCGQNIPK